MSLLNIIRNLRIRRHTRWTSCASLLPLFVAAGCDARGGAGVKPGTPLTRAGDEIVVCGRFFHTGTPVVLWMDPGGYDAYRVEPRFADSRPGAAGNSRRSGEGNTRRYDTLRGHLPTHVAERVRRDGWTLKLLQEYVDLFVIHYDACGTSQTCFKVLHDQRGLSVHFLLDIDGTIYQTLDLKERAWHAGAANDRSVGIEIANIGAYPQSRPQQSSKPDPMTEWYARDKAGRTVITLPERFGDGGIRTQGFVGRPARSTPIRGQIQGQALVQFDLTNEQYEALARLTATLARVLPRIRVDYPRDAAGRLHTSKLSSADLVEHSGLIGHYHISGEKIDPGPAFDWERLVADAQRALRR